MFRKGNMVEVVRSVHVDVQIGDCGVVESVYPDGYGVSICGKFARAFELNMRLEETRIVFFKPDDLKRVVPRLLDEKLVATLQQLQQQINENAKRARSKRLPTRK